MRGQSQVEQNMGGGSSDGATKRWKLGCGDCKLESPCPWLLSLGPSIPRATRLTHSMLYTSALDAMMKRGTAPRRLEAA